MEGGIQRLVSYGSSSSSEESFLSKKKRKRTVAHEESEVSSSVVQDEVNSLTAESTDDRATILTEMGCSYKQVAHAIDICGQATPVEDLFDFIEANQCTVREESTPAQNPVCQEATQMQSREACTLPVHITNSWVFTEQKKSVLEVPGYIHAPSHTEEASCSRSHHFEGHGQNEDENANTLRELERMGFTPDLVHRASEECNSIDFDVLLEHLVETTKENLLQNQLHSEVESLVPECQNETTSATPLQRLQMMGYSPSIIQRASDECNSIDFDVLLEYLIEAEDENSQNQGHSEMDSSEHEDGEVTPVMQLKKRGSPDTSIKKERETSGHEDLEELFDVFSPSEYMKKGDICAEWEGRQSLAHGRRTFPSHLERKSSSGGHPGTSRWLWGEGEVKWTGVMEKLWYSYIGSRRKSDSPSTSESENSENGMWGSSCVESSPHSRSRKKMEFLQSSKANKVGAMQRKMMGL